MSRTIITREDVEAAAAAGRLEVGPDAVVTQAARDLAQRTGVVLERAGGPLDPPPLRPTPAELQAATGGAERCLVTVVGRNRPYILAEITQRIAELGGNIQDISQRIVSDYFSTILVVDLERVDTFGHFKADMQALSQEGDYKVVVQHERVFRAMHRL